MPTKIIKILKYQYKNNFILKISSIQYVLVRNRKQIVYLAYLPAFIHESELPDDADRQKSRGMILLHIENRVYILCQMLSMQ
jgi:hypothetical protein